MNNAELVAILGKETEGVALGAKQRMTPETVCLNLGILNGFCATYHLPPATKHLLVGAACGP